MMAANVEQSPAPTSLTFVTYDGPGSRYDANVLRSIRKQAMKDVAAARRQRGNWGQHNLAQYPSHTEEKAVSDARGGKVCRVETPAPQQTIGPAKTRDKAATRQRSKPTVSYRSQSISRTPFPPLVLSESTFLLLKLIPLTGLRLGLATFPSPKQGLPYLPNPGTGRLLSFIPSRYHEDNSLRHAVNCLAAKLRQRHVGAFHETNGDTMMLRHYNKAVKALRMALEHEEESLTAETLCAAELLCALEVLNGNGDRKSWLNHVAGAARLIELRGIQRFQTEFEIALFTAHVGPAVMEAFLDNKACFLADTSWQQVLRTAVFSDESLGNEKPLVFALWNYLINGPGMFREVTEAVCNPNMAADMVEDLIDGLLRARQGLLQWLSLARKVASVSGNNTLESCSCILEDELNNGNNIQLTLRGTFAMCHILKARLLYALAPSRFYHLEQECQHLASKVIMSKFDQNESKNGLLTWTSSMSQSAWLAKGILETKESWRQHERGEGMIDKWKFEAWCKAIGRRCP